MKAATRKKGHAEAQPKSREETPKEGMPHLCGVSEIGRSAFAIKGKGAAALPFFRQLCCAADHRVEKSSDDNGLA